MQKFGVAIVLAASVVLSPSASGAEKADLTVVPAEFKEKVSRSRDWTQRTNPLFALSADGVDDIHLAYEGDSTPILVLSNKTAEVLSLKGTVRVSGFGGKPFSLEASGDLAPYGCRRLPMGRTLAKGPWLAEAMLETDTAKAVAETRFAVVRRRTVTPPSAPGVFRAGFNYHMAWYTDADNEKCLRALVQAGAKIVRAGILAGFVSVQKQEGVFDWKKPDRYLDLLAHDYYDADEISEASNDLMGDMAQERVDPSRLMKAVFIADSARVAAVIPSPLDFVYRIFSYGGIRQCTETPDADIFGRFFTVDELIAWYPCYNACIYSAMGNSVEFGDHILWAARALARDIIDRADAALRDDSPTAADLRFGHDSGILPLAGLMDLVGPGDRLHNADASDSWQSFFEIPMGSNLQMVFYRKRGAEPLVKVWYNEREMQVRGLVPVSGNCYRWSDLRAHLERRIEQFTF